ncbi:MAG: glycogen synthase GlgA [Alcanivorax sp.]|jgi:starch synthase|nr:glycogen synthase GlgA [Pseudomonadales bacterium]MCK5790034.1 glycogen synthase GlgA [Ketobacter sp.]MEC8813128.1 glycogen synthase GlgA [Pseudomonadota bacterium]TNC90061.1 MAG: glycogen synthase GlgA [Alcanivorax sp.]|tara:strand:+ start:2271 stop:3713 length:1443 start_codon:yes stop_codon:yes gene_type:complete
MNILFATSEAFPLIKTGGLGDVSYSLPRALQEMGHQVALILPGYRSVKHKLGRPDRRYALADEFLRDDVLLSYYGHSALGLPLYLVESDSLYDRDGGPYESGPGEGWYDNGDRFAQYCRAVVCLLKGGAAEIPQRFDVVHCNDWQTGLIPAFLQRLALPVRSVFTIHNLAYQGLFDRGTFDYLKLPDEWWHLDSLEFYGNFSFLKAGIVYADWVTTVSPTYAREIMHEPLACGMGGLLQHHRHKVVGILNGVDYDAWNPATDPYIRFHYDQHSLQEKINNKLEIQRNTGLRLSKSTPLIGLVSRLVEQKGLDWIVSAMEATLGEKVQWVVLGAGTQQYERQLQALAQANPKVISVTIGYDESLAHGIEAGCDLFAMPSRYEPCGLNQIYSLRYGSLPIVRRTGGLADTVIDASEDALEQGSATGFCFEEPSARAFTETVRRAIALYRKQKTWRKLQQQAMDQRFDWQHSAQAYLELYEQE